MGVGREALGIYLYPLVGLRLKAGKKRFEKERKSWLAQTWKTGSPNTTHRALGGKTHRVTPWPRARLSALCAHAAV